MSALPYNPFNAAERKVWLEEQDIRSVEIFHGYEVILTKRTRKAFKNWKKLHSNLTFHISNGSGIGTTVTCTSDDGAEFDLSEHELW